MGNGRHRNFYFAEMTGGDNHNIESTHSFDDSDAIAQYLMGKSLTHGILTTCLMSCGDISTILKPLDDYSIPGIDSDVIDGFLRMSEVLG